MKSALTLAACASLCAGVVNAAPVDVAFTDISGNKWAQVSDFTNLSWLEISSSCGSGMCSGQLNGHDVTGWKWATASDLTNLFTASYGQSNLSDPTLGYFNIVYGDNGVVDHSGLTPTQVYSYSGNGYSTSSKTVFGVLATRGEEFADTAGIASGFHSLYPSYNQSLEYVHINDFNVTGKGSFVGAWLYQSQSAAVAPIPEPETYAMMLAGLGLLGLTARRRTQKLNT